MWFVMEGGTVHQLCMELETAIGRACEPSSMNTSATTWDKSRMAFQQCLCCSWKGSMVWSI